MLLCFDEVFRHFYFLKIESSYFDRYILKVRSDKYRFYNFIICTKSHKKIFCNLFNNSCEIIKIMQNEILFCESFKRNSKCSAANSRTIARKTHGGEQIPLTKLVSRRHRAISRKKGPNRFSVVRLAAGTRSRENIHASPQNTDRIDASSGRWRRNSRCLIR